MEVVASLSQGHTAAAQCGLFTHKSVPVIFEQPCSVCQIDCFPTGFNKHFLQNISGIGNILYGAIVSEHLSRFFVCQKCK